MANENLCVFCGQKVGTFRSIRVSCGHTVQLACKACEKALKNLDEVEVCRRALVRGLADRPELVKERISLLTEAEDYRPCCLRCGEKLKFGRVEELDNSPLRDNLLSTTFDVLPAYCEACGKYEFYNPTIIRRNKHLAYLIWKDGQS